MYQSKILLRRLVNRIALFTVIGPSVLCFLVVVTNAAGVSFIDSVRGFLGMPDGQVVQGVPAANKPRAAVPLSGKDDATGASTRDGERKGLFVRTVSTEDDLPNFDIRDPKADETSDHFARFRELTGTDASTVAAIRDGFVRGETELRTRIPTVKVDYNPYLQNPEVIAPDVTVGRGVLAPPAGDGRAGTLRTFLRRNTSLIGISDDQIDHLKVTADYANPAGNLSFVRMEQTINGVAVFLGEVNGAFSHDGELFRVMNTTAPGLDYRSIPSDFGDPTNAVRAAFDNVSRAITSADTEKDARNSSELKTAYGSGDFATTAEKMYFPIEPGVVRAAWRILIWQSVQAYYVIVDAETGEMLWRKNIGADQTQPATYNVYSNDSPAPLSPTEVTPGSGVQAAGIGRTSITLIGNEAPDPGQNKIGWITDGTNMTDGNNVEAGPDIVDPNGVDAPVTGVSRVFNFTYDPPPHGSDAPSLPAYRNGAVTNLFYHTNRYHDFVYAAGFTEVARNFQNSNFRRGGASSDRISGEAQDSSGFNNASFDTPADGARGRMQMFLFSGPSPQRDGSLEADVMIHEMTHGTSNRIIGNAAGLFNNRGASMGEGWSDVYARLYGSTADEDVNAVYAMAPYVTLNYFTLGSDNYYYGIRRFPYAVKTNTGGPNNRPHNPLTFADIDPAQLDTSDGAYPVTSWIVNTANEVHNAGEVWSMMLLEVRARIISRLGFAAGNARMLQIATDGMKLTPTSPSFIQARDAILQADLNGFGGEDIDDIWAGFATRGAGFGAIDGGVAVVESFTTPNVKLGSVTFSDAVNGNNNGVPDPGETLILTVPIQNPLSDPITDVMATIDGGTQNYGTINGGTTISRNFNYVVPPATSCGGSLTVPVNITGSAGPISTSFILTIGTPVIGFVQNFDSLRPPAIPAEWTTAVTGSGVPWVSSTTSPDTPPNTIFTNDPITAGSSEVVTKDIPVTGASAVVQFRLNYDTDLGKDGSVLDVSIGGGAFQDLLAAGGAFSQNGYSGTLSSGSANPLTGRKAWTGTSGGAYVTVRATLPAAAAGQNIRLKFRAGSDAGVAGTGTRIDGLQVINSYTCSGAPSPTPSATPSVTPSGTPTPAITGTVTYGNAISGPTPPRPVSNVTISGMGSPDVSTMSSFPGGMYSLIGFGAGPYIVTPAKSDGVNSITSFDAARIAQHVAGVSALTGNQLIVADVSGNGSISSFDSAQVARYVVSSPPFGSSGNWTFSPASRSYATVESALTGQDYTALLMGEVSGNWFNTDALPDGSDSRSRSGNAQGRNVAITAPYLATPADQEVIVPVIVDGTGGKGIISYEFDLRYDPAVIQARPDAVDLVSTLSSKLSVASNVEEAGLLRVAVYGPTPMDGSGVLLNLRFTAVGAPGTVSPLRWERVMFNEGDPGTVAMDGQVELLAAGLPGLFPGG